MRCSLNLVRTVVVVVVVVLCGLAIPPAVQGQQPNASEEQVKAAFLLNFAKLAEWPPGALPESQAPLEIGVSGAEEDFLAVLRTVVAGKTAGTHPIQVKALKSVEATDVCPLIFFRSSLGRKRTKAAITDLTAPGILLVGEDEDFLREGGMINLVRDRESIRFEVNADALDHSGIHFSAKILALAKTVSGATHASASNSPTEEANPDAAKKESTRQEGARQNEPRRVVQNRAPDYPEIAKRMQLAGSVQVQAVVRPDGTVKEVKVIGGHPLLADALVHAVMQWRYQSASKETVESVKFTFSPP